MKVIEVRTLNTALKWQPGNEDIADFAEQARTSKSARIIWHGKNETNNWHFCDDKNTDPSLKCWIFVGGEGENGRRGESSFRASIPLIFQARKAQDGEMSEQEIKAIASWFEKQIIASNGKFRV